MNQIQVLMEHKTQGSMNVPFEKLQEFLDNGWIEKSRGPMGGFDPDAKPADVQVAAGGEQPPKETAKERKTREKAEREAADLAATGGEQQTEEDSQG